MTMDFEDFINRPGKLREQILDIGDKLEMYREQSKYSTSTPSLTPKGSPAGHSFVEDITIRIESAEEEIRRLEEEQRSACLELTQFLADNVEQRLQRRVLYERYVELKTFPVIVKSIKYSKQHVFRLHRDGLKEAKKRYLQK